MADLMPANWGLERLAGKVRQEGADLPSPEFAGMLAAMEEDVSRSWPTETIRATSMRRSWGVWRRRVFFLAGMGEA